MFMPLGARSNLGHKEYWLKNVLFYLYHIYLLRGPKRPRCFFGFVLFFPLVEVVIYDTTECQQV